MATTGFAWYAPPEKVFVPLAERYVNDIEARVLAIAQRRAPEIEAWMKTTHLWQNRTGAAEAGLHTWVEETAKSMVTIILSHGVDYGIWLETAHQGNYAIIAPAIDHWGEIIWSDVQAMLR